MKRLARFLEWIGGNPWPMGLAALANGALAVTGMFSVTVWLFAVYSAMFALTTARFCQLCATAPRKATPKIESKPPGLPLTNTPNAVADGQCGICGMNDPVTLAWEAESYGPCRLGDADVHRLCKEWFDLQGGDHKALAKPPASLAGVADDMTRRVATEAQRVIELRKQMDQMRADVTARADLLLGGYGRARCAYCHGVGSTDVCGKRYTCPACHGRRT